MFTTRRGLKVIVPNNLLHTFKEVFFSDDYFRGFPKSILKEKILTNIIDIGANVGYFSLYSANRFNSAIIHAFEPIPNNFNLLKKQIKINPKIRLKAHNYAVGKTNGTLALNYNENETYTTSASISKNIHGNNQITVNSLSIERYCSKNNIENIDLLKLDCEGAEYSILYGISPKLIKRIDMICLETHTIDEKNGNKNCLIKYLRQKEFTVRTFNNSNLLWAWR